MTARTLLPLVLLAAACGGGTPSTQAPVPEGDPEAVVTQFLRAVSDSNIAGITNLWGTERGPAAVTRQPPEYHRRAEIIQSYLKHDTARIVSVSPVPAAPANRTVVVELARRGCTQMVPFVTVPFRGGWLVSSVDLDAAGNPKRTCGPGRG